jgi:hypothetical protein
MTGKALGSLVYGISTTHLMAFCLASALILLAAFLACFRPAQALGRADPMESLRPD